MLILFMADLLNLITLWLFKMNKKQLERGIRVEMEHAQTIKKFMKKGVSVKVVAKHIAKDHLEESPNYYTQLSKVEGNFKRAKANCKEYNKKNTKK